MTKKWIEKRKRGFFGWVFLLLFWGWNALMLYAVLAGLANVGDASKTISADQQDAFAAGAGAGFIIELIVWAVGSVVFGMLAFFTRGKREMIEVEM